MKAKNICLFVLFCLFAMSYSQCSSEVCPIRKELEFMNKNVEVLFSRYKILSNIGFYQTDDKRPYLRTNSSLGFITYGTKRFQIVKQSKSEIFITIQDTTIENIFGKLEFINGVSKLW